MDWFAIIPYTQLACQEPGVFLGVKIEGNTIFQNKPNIVSGYVREMTTHCVIDTHHLDSGK